MNPLSSYRAWKMRRQLERLKHAGLQIADDCRLMGLPDFGSEPYLISIGKHVTISAHVRFINHDGGTWVFRDDPRVRGVIKYGRIVIHDNCFIGMGATLLPGAEVGPNSVIAAGAVVARAIPANCVAGGVPARFIKSTEDYLQHTMATSPKYDREAYARNKAAELTRLYPRPW